MHCLRRSISKYEQAFDQKGSEMPYHQGEQGHKKRGGCCMNIALARAVDEEGGITPCKRDLADRC